MNETDLPDRTASNDFPPLTSCAGAESLTRVVDGSHELDMAQLHSVLARIHRMLPLAPAAERDYMAKALLALAIATTIKDEARAAQAGTA